MKKPDYETASREELLIWIAYQDKILDGPNDLQKMLSYTCSMIAEDLEMVLSGQNENLKLLSGNKDDKIFERITVLIKLKSEFSSLSLLPDEVEKVVKSKISRLKLGDSAFEVLMAEAKERNGSPTTKH